MPVPENIPPVGVAVTVIASSFTQRSATGVITGKLFTVIDAVAVPVQPFAVIVCVIVDVPVVVGINVVPDTFPKLSENVPPLTLTYEVKSSASAPTHTDAGKPVIVAVGTAFTLIVKSCVAVQPSLVTLYVSVLLPTVCSAGLKLANGVPARVNVPVVGVT